MAVIRTNISYEIDRGIVRKIIDHGDEGAELIVSMEGEGDFDSLYQEAVEAGAVLGDFEHDDSLDPEVLRSDDVEYTPID